VVVQDMPPAPVALWSTTFQASAFSQCTGANGKYKLTDVSVTAGQTTSKIDQPVTAGR
jgi:hypothetical protein